MKKKRDLFYVFNMIGFAPYLFWVMTAFLYVPEVKIYSHEIRALVYFAIYLWLIGAPFLFFLCIKSYILVVFYRIFKVDCFFDSLVARLKKLTYRDKIMFNPYCFPFKGDNQLYKLTNEFIYICDEKKSKTNKWPWICYELTGTQNSRLLLSFINSDKIKFSKPVTDELFLNKVSSLNETELLDVILRKGGFHIYEEVPSEFAAWMTKGKHLFKDSKTFYIEGSAKKVFNVSKLLRANKNKSCYCFISGLSHVLSEQYRMGYINYRYPEFETAIEINFVDNKITEIYLTYTIDVKAIRDYIYINPPEEDPDFCSASSIFTRLD